jgi:hypothetical protein
MDRETTVTKNAVHFNAEMLHSVEHVRHMHIIVRGSAAAASEGETSVLKFQIAIYLF